MSDIQRRFLGDGKPAELIEREGKLPKITGYAAVFYREGDKTTEFRIFNDVVERISRTAFDNALKRDDVRGLFNHESNLVLGRTSAGTLKLSVDERGLKYEIDPPDTQAGRDAVELIRRGDVNGSSFAFIPRSTLTTRAADGTLILERTDVELFDVGPVTFPAYSGSTTSVRSLGESLSEEIELARVATMGKCPDFVMARKRVVELANPVAE